MPNKSQKTLAIATLGCKVNQYESQAIKEQFQEHNFTLVDFSQKPDVYIINTCTVTKKSDKESGQLIRRAHQKNQKADIIVTGCYTHHNLDKISDMKGVSLIVNNEGKSQIFNAYQNFNQEKTRISPPSQNCAYPPLSIKNFPQKSRAFVKIQDGCKKYCSYCIVPYVRGESRSRTFKDIIEEVNILTTKGFKEIVLTGINLGQYGKDLSPVISLSQVIEKLCQHSKLKRLRLSSLNISAINEELIDLIEKNPKICKHLHIPLQSGSDFILKKMNREYTSKEYEELINRLRERIPEMGITTDILVGFPGEEDIHFHETYELVKKLKFSRTHIFKYSPRLQTKAYSLPNQVSEKIKSQRSANLRKLSIQNMSSFMQKYAGKKIKVLIEEYKPSLKLYFGYSSNYIRVGVKSLEDIIGKIIAVNVKEARKDYMVGEVANDQYI